MKQYAILPLFALALMVIAGGSAIAKPLSGTISGTVKDAQGRPLSGVLVSVHDVDADEALKATKTDKNGRYIAANLTPGRYALKATAVGYKSELIAAATVTPHQTTVFNLTLRRVSELINAEKDAESYRYVLRRNRTIFQYEKDQPQLVAEEKRPFVRETHGFVNFAFTQAASRQPGAGSSAGFNFALSQMLNENIEVVVAGQTGIGRLNPQRIDTQASVQAGDNHQLTLAIGYGRLPVYESVGRTNQVFEHYNLRATDKWHIAGPVVIVYGFDYTRFEGIGSTSNIAPRFNFDLQVSARDQVYAAIYSPNGADIESTEEFETTRVDFHGPVEIINLNPDMPIARNLRYEIGYNHTFKNKSSIDAAVFWDTSNNTVNAFSLNNEGGQQDSVDNDRPQLFGLAQKGRARGVRVIFARPINEQITASVGYAVGNTHQLEINAEGQPGFNSGFFQVITGKVDANLSSTGTRVSTVLRLASPRAVFAIDPFQQHLRSFDPNVSIYVTQSLPKFSFVPGRWEATIDARNLLDAGNGDENLRLAIGQYWRSIRGGLSVRF